jgi:hypothetical protein
MLAKIHGSVVRLLSSWLELIYVINVVDTSIEL